MWAAVGTESTISDYGCQLWPYVNGGSVGTAVALTQNDGVYRLFEWTFNPSTSQADLSFSVSAIGAQNCYVYLDEAAVYDDSTGCVGVASPSSTATATDSSSTASCTNFVGNPSFEDATLSPWMQGGWIEGEVLDQDDNSNALVAKDGSHFL